MPDIKTHNVVTGTIKTAHRSVNTLNRDVRESERFIKGAAESSGIAGGEPVDAPENAPANVLEYAEMRAAGYVGRQIRRGTGRAIKSSVKAPFKAKGRMQAAKAQAQTAKSSVKTAGHTIKESAHTIKTAAQGVGKATQATVKTADVAVKTAQATAKTAQVSAQTAVKTAQTTVQTAKVAAKATVEAVKATGKAAVEVFKAVISGAEALGSAIAAGGWIVIVVILVVAVIVVLIVSAFGIYAANDTDGRTLDSVQQEISVSFDDELTRQLQYLQDYDYDKLAVRPAPQITRWNDIIAVYAVLSQHDGKVAIEMTDDAVERLTQVVSAMISYEASVEELTYTETDADGNQTAHSVKVGIVNVLYKTPEEMADKYGFTADERALLMEIIDTQAFDELRIIGGETLKNPCPAGAFVLDDYPSKPDSTVYHAGRDIMAAVGSPVLAAADGKVTHVNDMPGVSPGHIAVEHADGRVSVYAHCDSITVTVGQAVTAGQTIAAVAAPPESEGGQPHLHFEVRNGDNIFTNTEDPLRLFR